MTCQEVQMLVSAHVDGELSQGERRDVDTHLASCAECRRRREALAAVRTALQSIEPETVSESFDAILGRRLTEARAMRRRRRWRPLAVALSAAAALVLAFLVLITRQQPAAVHRPVPGPHLVLPTDTRPCRECGSLLSDMGWPADAPCASPASCGLVMPTAP